MRTTPDPLASDVLARIRCPSCGGCLIAEQMTCASCLTHYDVDGAVPILLDPAGRDDPHKQQQRGYFDAADEEFEITRPAGLPRLYGWLLNEKARRGLSALDWVGPDTLALVACAGSGLDAEQLAARGARVVAADISSRACRRTSERAARHDFAVQPIVADVEHLPFADRSFDLVYVHDGLHHLQDPMVGLRELARVTRLAVSVNEPARAAATYAAIRLGAASHVEEAGNRIERIDPEEVASVLEAEGFEVVRRERYAMYYRHVPGNVFRVLSHEPLFSLTKVALEAFNRVAGRFGNKSTVQAVRRSDATDSSTSSNVSTKVEGANVARA